MKSLPTALAEKIGDKGIKAVFEYLKVRVWSIS